MSTVAAAPVPALSCVRCGAAATSHQQYCTSCGGPLPAAPVLGDARGGLFTGVTKARGSTLALSWLVDCCVVAVAAVLGAVLMLLAAAGEAGTAGAAPVVGAVLGAATGIAVTAVLQSRTGRALGGLLTRLRTVDRTSGLPVPLPRALGRLLRRTHRSEPAPGAPRSGPWSAATGRVVVDLARGRDPLSPSMRAYPATLGARAPSVQPVAGDGLGALEHTVHSSPRGQALPPATQPSLARVPPGAAVLAFDSGAMHWFTGSCVLGRNPSVGPGFTAIAVPDLSRTLSKTHIALVLHGDTVTVRDLGSTNGTTIESGNGTRLDLTPGMEVEIEVGSTVLFGDHAFRLNSIGEVTA